MQQTTTLVVGASLAGLAVAASLQKQDIAYTCIEKESQVASPWHRHYQRLHLHTNKRVSCLPYKKFNRNIPRYPSRQQVINYAEEYRQHFDIKPLFNTEALMIKRENGYWIAETNKGTIQSKYVVMATGAFGNPKPVYFHGIETFRGNILHSSAYKTGKDFKAQNVLVVGFGNSACEIAIDLYEQGTKPAMSVRSAVNILPRQLAGIPILEWSLLMSKIPSRIADIIIAPLMRLKYGDITKLGLERKKYGPFEEIEKDRNIPVLDIGTIEHIRKKHIKIFKGIDYINGNTVYFSDGIKHDFDTIVACIGFDNRNAGIVAVDSNRFEDAKLPIDKQQYFGKDGLYFCGFWVAATGHIRQIASDSIKIAKNILGKEHQVSFHPVTP